SLRERKNNPAIVFACIITAAVRTAHTWNFGDMAQAELPRAVAIWSAARHRRFRFFAFYLRTDRKSNPTIPRTRESKNQNESGDASPHSKSRKLILTHRTTISHTE